MRRCALSLCAALLALAVAAPAAEQGKAAAADKVMTNFAILVGFPSEGQEASGAVLLVPGTVIPSDADRLTPENSGTRDRIVKGLSFDRTAEKLWSTFRLDPGRRIQKGKYAAAGIGLPLDLPDLETANIRITSTLLGFTPTTASYRVVFRQGEKSLADSTVNVTRGGRTVVGGTDGAAAPYVFVIVEPDSPGESADGLAAPGKFSSVTQPVIVKQVPPKYPEEAKKSGARGVVLVDVLIAADGRVEDARAIEYPDPYLAKAAIEALREWVYKPAVNDKGTPIKVKATVTIRFELR